MQVMAPHTVGAIAGNHTKGDREMRYRHVYTFLVFDDLLKDEPPFMCSTWSHAIKKARRLNQRGFDVIICDQNENTLETWLA
jgi:hypothetical protein